MLPSKAETPWPRSFARNYGANGIYRLPLHTLRSRNTEKVQATTQNLGDGIVEPQACNVAFIHRVIPARSDTALAIPRVVGGCELLQVTRNAVRFTQVSGLCNLRWELCKHSEKVAISCGIKRCRIETSLATHTVFGSITRNILGASMRILHVVHRVLIRIRSQEIQIDIEV